MIYVQIDKEGWGGLTPEHRLKIELDTLALVAPLEAILSEQITESVARSSLTEEDGFALAVLKRRHLPGDILNWARDVTRQEFSRER